MPRDRRGQATLEALAAALLLIVLIAVGGACGLVPLTAFFVEDRMEEALVCMTHRPMGECHRRFEKQTRKGIVRLWVKRASSSCDGRRCRITVTWAWPTRFAGWKLLPERTTRSLPRRISV